MLFEKKTCLKYVTIYKYTHIIIFLCIVYLHIMENDLSKEDITKSQTNKKGNIKAIKCDQQNNQMAVN